MSFKDFLEASGHAYFEVPYRYFEFFEAWNYLKRFRQLNGLAISPLSFQDCLAYADRFGVPGRYSLRFCDAVITIDQAWIAAQQDEK